MNLSSAAMIGSRFGVYAWIRRCAVASFSAIGFIAVSPLGVSHTNAQTLVAPEQVGSGFEQYEPGEMIVADEYVPVLTPIAMEVPVERFRRGFYQGSEVSSGYVHGLGDRAGGLNQTFFEARVAVGVPLGSLKNILAVSPFFRVDSIDGPTSIDVPETLYSTGVTLFQRKEWTERVSTTFLLTPSVRSDFTTSEDAFRLFGLGMVSWQVCTDWNVALGAVYFDRSDLSVLPVIGATWTPRPWCKLDLTMPRPRLSYRLWKDGGVAEAWAYIGGQLGGNTWAVSRDDGSHDELTIGELRLLFGYEVIRQGNRGLLIEGGYAFNRSVEYERANVEVDLDDGLFLQAGWKF
ncbi:hypothetical protein FHS27_005542 [Rhodopirellula rubra]|uniref:Uncharacterized protein n=1 Tax=Aporhodopirellula rubra TaxID=980271 RepID=A0A7W5E5J5_9BACT|nr:hypothetical protein [Aporhodopirellula rubra]MBB3209702.1 hypothetical protein [Aporhodopirellula rubra]